MLLAAVRQSVMLFERERLLNIAKRHNELERTFQTLFQITRGGLALLEPDGRFREMNPSCLELLGCSREQAQRITLASVNASQPFHMNGPLGLVDENGNGVIEVLIRRMNGTLVDIELTSALIPDSGGQVFVIMRDITERKQASEQLQSMAQRLAIATRAAGLGIWEFRAASNALLWDEYMHELYGTPGGDAPRDWLNYIHVDDRPELRRLYEQALTGICGYHTEYRVIRPDGSLRHVESWGDIQLDANHKLERMIGVNMDITARKQAEAVRLRLEAQLRHSQKLEAIGTLASGIAHDFNNVLGAILGNIELSLQDIHEDHAATISMHEIRKAGQRGKDLVRRIVAFGKPYELEFKPTQLTGVIEDSLKLVRAVLPASVEINCQLEAKVPRVSIDSSQIAQVLLNICTNAYQAMDQQKGRIDITLKLHQLNDDAMHLHRDLKPGCYVCLSISDNGSGIDPTIVDRIFEPFFTTKSMTEGSGLGLSIVHNIVRSHGGAIELDSERGKGSTFHIYLPAPETLESPETTPKHAQIDTLVKGTGQHLLYVDDEGSLVFLTKRMLERLGYRVTGFTEADEALAAALADDADFDLIITDHSMPVMTGIDLARELFAKRPDARVVLVSGYLPPHDVERARAIGIHDVLLKPDTVDELAATVHRLLSA
jgi:PAS domain S-box-containing protein